jgi:hypothetical protein
LVGEVARRHPAAQNGHHPNELELPAAETNSRNTPAANSQPAARAAVETMPPRAVPELALISGRAQTGPEDLPYSAASRLGGLRNLMTSLGIKNLHKEVEHRRADSDPDYATERSVFAQPDTPLELDKGRVKTPPHEVKAAPEIIPPRVAGETAEHEREKEMARPAKTTRISQWDTVDEVETLPSRRGQYRKRR